MSFDSERKGTGTAEWAEVTENICRGCPNNCLYCYAAHNANRFKQRSRSDWEREEFTKRADMTSYPARDGVVMFPSSHDITPFNLEVYIRIARLILQKGNRLLIVSKPRMECIYAIMSEFADYKDRILFRFTIGSMATATCNFWEPGAPSPGERVACLRAAFELGFRTSVSIEPMLAGIGMVERVIDACERYVTDTIWIGKMNKIRTRVSAEHADAVENIEWLQRDSEILRMFRYYDGSDKVRWKDSIKEVVAKIAPDMHR